LVVSEKVPLGITDVVLRDAHQSLLATRMRIEDMLPIAAKLDARSATGPGVLGRCHLRCLHPLPRRGSLGALRELKKAMPNTPQQMLLRGQNLLGYRHYADDVVDNLRRARGGQRHRCLPHLRRHERPAQSGAGGDARSRRRAHAQGTMSYTVSPVHDIDYWVDMGRRLEDMGCHSICIKDMAGLLRPYVGEELVSRLKETARHADRTCSATPPPV
jgi:oxaloacetate decarboxylase alpha subunit